MLNGAPLLRDAHHSLSRGDNPNPKHARPRSFLKHRRNTTCHTYLEKMDSQGLELAIIAVLLPSALIMIGLVYKTWTQRTERTSRELRGKRVILSTPRRLLPDCFWSIYGHTLLLNKDNVRGSILAVSIPVISNHMWGGMPTSRCIEHVGSSER